MQLPSPKATKRTRSLSADADENKSSTADLPPSPSSHPPAAKRARNAPPSPSASSTSVAIPPTPFSSSSSSSTSAFASGTPTSLAPRRNAPSSEQTRHVREMLQMSERLKPIVPSLPFVPDDLLAYTFGFVTVRELLVCVRCTSRHFWKVSHSKLAWPQDINLSPYRMYIDDEVVLQFAESKLVQRLAVSGSIIDSFGLQTITSLSSLRSLNISDCSQLTDADLPFLLTLPNLCTLDLSRNRWLTDAGVLNLTGLRLRKLKLVKCPQITDKACQYLLDSKMPLAALDISHSANLTSAGLRPISEITSLRELAVSKADNKDDVILLSRLDLFTLRLYQSNLPPGTLRHFAFTPLLNFELYHCHHVVDADIQAALSGMPDHPVRRLIISHCQSITGHGMPVLTTLRHLEVLSFHHCSNLESLQFLRGMQAPLLALDLSWCERIRLPELECLVDVPPRARVVVASVPWSASKRYQDLKPRFRWRLSSEPIK